MLRFPDPPTPYETALLGRPATRLVVAALHADTEALGAEVARAEAAGVRWPRVLAAAHVHRVVPHVARALEPVPGVPDGVRERLRSMALRNARRQLALAKALRHLTAALDAAGVPSLALKGPTLATWLYGDPARRTSRDLDVLVAPGQVPAAVAVARAAGFDAPAPEGGLVHRLLTPAEAGVVVAELGDNDVSFLHPGHGVILELHWRPFLDPRLRAISDALGADRAIGAAGAIGAPAAVAAYVLAHGAFHGYRRLGWLADAAALTTRVGDDGWARALTLAKADGIETAVLLGPFLAERVLGAPVPEPLTDRVREREGALRALSALCVAADGGLLGEDAHRVRLALYDRRADRAHYLWDRLTRPYRTDLVHGRLDTGAWPRLRRRLRRAGRMLTRRPVPGPSA